MEIEEDSHLSSSQVGAERQAEAEVVAAVAPLIQLRTWQTFRASVVVEVVEHLIRNQALVEEEEAEGLQ